MRILLFYFLLLSAESALCQTISFKVFNKACDSMTYYDVVSNYSFEMSENEKIFAQRQFKKYNKTVFDYKSQHPDDSMGITISIISNYIQHAYSFKKNDQYYLALRSCDKSVDCQLKLSDRETDLYWNPQLSEMHFNRALIYYDIFKTVGFSIGADEQLLGLLSNVTKNIQTVSSFELTQTFRLFSESELQNKYSIESINKLYNTFCKEVTRRYENKAITDVQYFLCNTILLEYFESNHRAELDCSIEFDKVYQTIVNNLKSRKIETMDGAFYFKPYLQWLIRTLPNNDLGNNKIGSTLDELIKLGIYSNHEAAIYDLTLSNEDTKTLNFTDYIPLKKELNKVLFWNRNFNNKLIERNAVSNFGYQSYTAINFVKDTSCKIDYNKFVFDFLNLFDFENTDKQILSQINKIPQLSELSYFSVIEYQIRKSITDSFNHKYIGINELINKLDTNEAFIYTSNVDLNFGVNNDSPDKYVAQNAKNLFIVTKNKPPRLFVLNNFIVENFFSDYNININSNQRMPEKVKKALIGINKIYTFDDPWPWVLLDTDGNYICHNYEFHKITSLNEIINKSENVKSDYVSKSAIVYSNPDFNNSVENKYAVNDNKHTDTPRSANEDLVYYSTNNNNKGSKEEIILNALPNTEIEAKEIVDILNRNKIKTFWYNNNNAKEEYLYNHANPYILHFATHGSFLNKDALDRSFLFYNTLALCNASNTINSSYSGFFANKSDGLLTGLEIVKLDLSNTELVVLSACETGKGTAESWINGTYYNSLQRAFRLAGAKAVLASKWIVPDQQTQELMVEFYTNWLEKKMTKHKALQQAQLTLSKKYPDPYSWAAWVLYGE